MKSTASKWPLFAGAALSLLLGTAVARDTVHRCVDGQGKVTYQAQACPGAGGGARLPELQPGEPAMPGAAPASPSPERPPARVLAPSSAPASPVESWGADADVIVVSGYEFSARVTQVHITHSTRPVLLVLTSYEATEWRVLPAPGTTIKAIVVSAGDGRRSRVAPLPDVPVVVDQLPSAYETGNIHFRELLGKLHARYGVRQVLGYRGGYRLPELVPVAGPFLPDPYLNVDGVLPEVARLRFSFDLVSIDGRRLRWTNTGARDGQRHVGIVRGGTLSSPQAPPAAVREDGREAYWLEGNGGTLMWAPSGFGGPRQKLVLPPTVPELSWASGIAWDTRKGVLAIVSFGSEGYFYRYDTRNRQWLDARSLQNRDLYSLTFNPGTGGWVALSDKAELVTFNERGELEGVQPLQALLRDLDSTYDKGNGRLDQLTVAADGTAVAILNVRKGTVTHIWTWDQVTRRAQLTYKLVE